MRQRVLLLAPAVFALGSPAAVVVFFLNHSLDPRLPAPTGHFYIVSAVALTCLALSVPAAIATLRASDIRLLALTLAFLSIAGFFSVHALATPGFLVPAPSAAVETPPADAAAAPAEPAGNHSYGGSGGSGASTGSGGSGTDGGHPGAHGGAAAPAPRADVVGFSARLAMVFGALFLAASAINWPARVTRGVSGHAGLLIGGWVATLLAYCFAGVVVPQYLPPGFLNRTEVLNASLVVVLAASVFAAVRYARAFHRSTLPLHASAALAGVLMFEAQVVMHFGEVWYASWWIYHFQLLVGFGVLLGGVSTELFRGRSAVDALDRLSLRDAISQIEAGFSDSIRTLAASLEARDPYTHGHGRRVAALAYYAGRELGFSARHLRAVVSGALLHDVGKIGIPDAILLKAGVLSDDEYTLIKSHPDVGERLLKIAGPGAVERAIIRHHHEWLDGSGYPDGLRGDAIPLEARLVAVADVYDALRSNRAYRPAWSRERTVELLHAETGTHFDPRCVEALLRVADTFERDFEPEAAQQRMVAPVAPQAAA